MSLQPYYEPSSVTPHYKLRYGWAGWPTRGTQFPKEMECHLSAPAKGWEKDGLRVLETSFSPECLLMTFSVKPDVAPCFSPLVSKDACSTLLRKQDFV